MASSHSVKPPITRPKPRGVNVRAFIESVEKGSKPTPDFFTSETDKPAAPTTRPSTASRHKAPPTHRKPQTPTTNYKATVPKTLASPRLPHKPRKTIKGSVNKPPVHKKPSLAQRQSVASLGVGVPAASPSAETSTNQTTGEEEDRVSDINCPSEDSGVNSTCDLKYSGSVSSNQSSNYSHETNYQTLSELDDGYCETVVSGNDTVEEAPQYTDPSTIIRTHNESNHSQAHSNRSASSKIYHSAYKYHVPGKLGGTLPRDKKKAAMIGKAVAKGRNTLKKKASSSTSEKTVDDSSSIKDNSSTLKSSTMSDSMNQSDYDDFSDSEFDTDYSDAEWETDGEQNNNKDNHSSTNITSAASISETGSDAQPALHDSDSEGEIYRDPAQHVTLSPTSSSNHESKSRFYTVTEPSAEEELVSLMRNHSTKKEKQARLKKRLKHLKGNLLKQSAAVKTFIGKLKKPVAPKPDYDVSEIEEKPSTMASSTFFVDRQESGSDCQSDALSISSHNSHLSSQTSENLQSLTSSSTTSLCQPGARGRASTATDSRNSSATDTRAKTQSLGALVVPPPLPPRGTKSEFIPETTELDYLDAPAPPPRTSSRGGNLSSESADNSLAGSGMPARARALTEQPGSQASSYTPRFTKSKHPQAAPRSPVVARSSSHAAELTAPTHKLSLPDQAALNRVSAPELSLRKTPSAPVLTSRQSIDGGAPLVPHIPVRRESSKSLVTAISSQDESIKRRNEILHAAKSTSSQRERRSVTRRTSTPPIHEEESSLETTSVPTGDSSVPPPTTNTRVPPPTGSLDVSSGEDAYVEVTNKLIEDEPLYQEYHECMVSSVKRRSINRTSTLMRGGQPSMSLWSTTSAVMTSGVLDHMNNEEIKLQEAMFEVITSEASYLRSIKMLNSVFVNSTQFECEEVLPARDKKDLFSNITAVLDVSTRLFTELEAHWKSSVILTAVCEIISKYAYREFDVYIKYCSNQAFQDRTLKKLLSNNVRFQESLALLEKSPECHGLTMSSFLLLPMQRITRLPLLMDAILRRQEAWSDQYRNAQRCYEHIKKVVIQCNEGARKMEQTEQVLSIENKLLFNKIKKIPLTSSSRQLVKKGDLAYLCADGGRSTTNLLSVKSRNLSLFLFSDLLLITKKKGEYYAVVDYASRVNVEIEEWCAGGLKDPRLNMMAQKAQAKFLFMLVLLENHQKKHSEFLLSCHTETERTRWTEAFTPQSHGDSDDKIYELWDCPQVQVTHDYTAKQPDELSVGTGEILNVIRKTPDGWYEGSRVSDGQSGWLPSSYTFELQNEHVRAKHLKERNKLLQVAAKLMK